MYLNLVLALFLLPRTSNSQVSIGSKTPDPSSMLEVKSNKKGMLVPRMSSLERKNITAPAIGLLVYQTDGTNGFYYYSGTEWKFIPPANTASGNLATEATTATVSSVSGTVNRISSTGGTNPVLDIASTYVGQASITTLGTIATGNWNAMVIPATKGGAGTINGLLKANGSGTVSAAVKGTDYAPALKLTTTGTSGACSYNATTGTLNIPVYAGGSGVSYTFNAPLSLSGSSVSLPLATAAANGYLSSSDWTLFNNKLNSNLSITAGTKTKISYDNKGLVLSGSDATTTDIAEGSNQYFTEQRVLNSKLTGLTTGNTAELTAADNIQGALQNLQAQIKTKSSVADGSNKGDMLYWDGTAWIKIPVGEEAQSLILCKGVPTWGGCPAELSTDSVNSIQINSAMVYGSLLKNGGTTITEHGFTWDSLPSSNVSTNKLSLGNGVFSGTLSGLVKNTTYYVRSYAINSKGIAYGNEITFKTPDIDLTTGLVAYYPFNGNANDESGNGHDGFMFGGVSKTSDRFGNSDNALLFDGSTGYISIPTLDTLSYSPITYSIWVIVKSSFPSSPGHKFLSIIGRNSEYVVENGILGFYADLNVQNGSYDNTFVMWRGGGVTGDDPVSNFHPPLGEWCHILYSQDSDGNWVWYINGIKTSQGKFLNIQNEFNCFKIGGRCGMGFWNDKLDDIRIYNRALSDAEVKYLASH